MARAPADAAAAGNRIYEEVQPQYRWVHGEKEDTLVVDLRGFKNEVEFKKEHLTILIDNYGNLKVSGERPIGGIRWSRFQKVHHLPEDCNATGIRAVFDKGLITVTIPKLVKDKPAAAEAAPPQKPPSAAQATAPPKPEPKAPAAVPSAPTAPLPRKPEKSVAKPATVKGDAQQTAPERAKEQAATAPADSERKAAEPGKKEEEPSSVAEKAPPPPVPAEKAAPHVPKPPPLPRMEAAEMAGVRRRHVKRLANVVVALMVVLGLLCYLLYRYRTTQGDQQKPDVVIDSLGDSSSARLSL